MKSHKNIQQSMVFLITVFGVVSSVLAEEKAPKYELPQPGISVEDVLAGRYGLVLEKDEQELSAGYYVDLDGDKHSDYLLIDALKNGTIDLALDEDDMTGQ